MTHSDVLETRRGALAVIELNRPQALNALTPEMGVELLGAVRRAGADPAVRAVLIAGAGRAFCAGADLKVPRELTPEGEPDLHTRLETIYNPIILELRRTPKPVLGAVQGSAAGLGFSLALACDLLVASESASFLLAFVRVGLVPDGGALAHLLARIGPARTAMLAMLGRRLAAGTALEWGIVNEVVPDGQERERAVALAEELAAMPTVAIASMKELINAASAAELASLMALEAITQQRQAATEDYREGVAAFKEKRPPRFRGI
jgi:2-(1,2-epoxy-1,2-dihydrophenyl)acetyl-CoA isomerase